MEAAHGSGVAPATHRGALLPVVALACGADSASAEECCTLLRSAAELACALVVVGPPLEGLQRSGVHAFPAVDGQVVTPGNAYVVRPGQTVRVAGDTLTVRTPRPDLPHRPFLELVRSLIASRGVEARAAMLSAAPIDGVVALRELRAAGGVAFASHPTFDPLEGASASDAIAPAGEIPRRIAGAAPGALDLGGDVTERLAGLYVVLADRSGAGPSRLRTPAVVARVLRRMAITGVSTFGAYVDRLDRDTTEVDALIRDLGRRQFGFFRDPDLVDHVRRVVSARLADPSDHEPLRVWAIGCGTGEVAYSLAMAATEALEASGRAIPLRVLATEQDELLLERARRGSYPAAIDLDVGPERLARFFVRGEQSHQVRPALRDVCTFGRHDILEDPPFGRIDLVWCRDILRHLDPDAAAQIVPRIRHALRPEGRAALDPADPVDPEELDPVAAGLYRRGRGRSARSLARPARPPPALAGRVDVKREAEQTLLEQLCPPAVIIDGAGTILAYHGDMSPWLAPRPGQAGLNVDRMVRPDLVAEVRRLMAAARTQGERVRTRAFPTVGPDGAGFARINVAPVRRNGSACWIIAFEEDPVGTDPSPPPGLWADRVAKLEREIADLHGSLGTVIAERREALDTAHEEIQSLGEEYQATHADLAQAKRELELVNEELRVRNQALAAINVELEGLLGALDLPIVMLGADLRVLRMTAAAGDVFRTRSADVGRPIGHLRHTFDVDLEAIARQVLATGEPASCDARDRSGRWCHVTFRSLGGHGPTAGVVVAAIDIDALRRSLERADAARRSAEALVEAMDLPLLVVDGGLRIHRTNRAFAELAGIAHQDLVGARLPDVPWAEPGDFCEVLAAVAGEAGPCRVEIEVSRGGDAPRWFEISARSIDWPDRDERLRLLAVDDVTERRRELERAHALTAERAARVAAEHGSRAKDEYLAMLAHELRNPLAPLQTALQLMDRAGAPPVWALAVARRQVSHLSRILDDLLDASRLTRNKIVPRVEPVDLLQIVEQAVEGRRSTFEDADLALEVALPDAGPRPWLLADPVRIDQVLVNLLTNAAKYSTPGGTVRVSLEARGGEAIVSVRDEGVGIAPELLPRVFEPFVQAEQRIDRSHGGLGIGLTIVKQLVEMHGGSVAARSEGLGFGSEFVVRLPVHPPPEPSAVPEAVDAPATPRLVLVVDDNRDAGDTLAMLLRDVGHTVHVTYDGPSALDAADGAPPDVILLDLGLPGMDGFEVASEIRRRHGSRIRLIALTGYGDDAHRRRAVQVGFDDHILKPIPHGALEQLMLDPMQPCSCADAAS